MHGLKIPQKCKTDQWILTIDIVPDAILQLTLSTYHVLGFGVVSKKNIHNHLERLLKYFFLFQPRICVRLDFLCIF